MLNRIRLNSDAGSQYTSVRFGQTLMLAGMKPSIGSVGDAYDNALAETTIGLYKTEAVRKDWPISPRATAPTGRRGTAHRRMSVVQHQAPHAPP